ncbi:MAG: DUF2877 domain-containing protein [Jatrophihabitantaceae bacterium]
MIPGIRVTAGAIGSVIDLRAPRAGRVHSVFTHAVNLELGDQMWTVVARGGHDAALTVRLAGVVVPGDLGLRIHDPVWVRSSHVRVGAAVIDARTAVRWMPRMYDVALDGLGERVAELEASACHVAWEGSWMLADGVAGALASGDRLDLEDTVRRTIGCGPGLTPAGDDVLVGILAVLTAAGHEPVAARLRAALAPALPATTEISQALLGQASRGHVSRPVRELAGTVLSGRAAAASAQARAAVLATGATSGGDTCAGLATACRLLLSRSPEGIKA